MISQAVRGARRRSPVVEEAMDAYLGWREECAAATEAYRRWADAATGGQATAWREYELARDREERASTHYLEMVQRVEETEPASVSGPS